MRAIAGAVVGACLGAMVVVGYDAMASARPVACESDLASAVLCGKLPK